MDWSGLIEKAMEGMERAYAPILAFGWARRFWEKAVRFIPAATWNPAHTRQPAVRSAPLWSKL